MNKRCENCKDRSTVCFCTGGQPERKGWQGEVSNTIDAYEDYNKDNPNAPKTMSEWFEHFEKTGVSSRPLEPEFAKIISENFWDLV